MDYSALEYIAGVTSRTVTSGPALLLSVLVSGDGANGDCQVYDGASDTDPQKAHIEVPSGTSFLWKPIGCCKMHNGIHVVVNATTTKVTVEYIPLPH